MDGKIKHIVFIVKENHGFDNYFGTYKNPNGMSVDGQDDLEKFTSPQLPIFNKMPLHVDHKYWLDRQNAAVRKQFTQAHIPGYFSYADEFTLCDNFFTEITSGSWPNHVTLFAAKSPVIDNPKRDEPQPGPFDYPCLPKQLDAEGISWRCYYGDKPHLFRPFWWVKYLHNILGTEYPDFEKTTEELANELPASQRHLTSAGQFLTDCRHKRLPAVSWVYANHEFSEHQPVIPNEPGGNVLTGSEWTVRQVEGILANQDESGKPYWESTAIFITWDDWGAWHDHVTPDNVLAWDDHTQFRYGNRVGCLVLSPYAKRVNVCKTRYSLVSLVRFCQSNFDLGPLGAWDTPDAGDMLDCFDFNNPHNEPPTYRAKDGGPSGDDD